MRPLLALMLFVAACVSAPVSEPAPDAGIIAEQLDDCRVACPQEHLRPCPGPTKTPYSAECCADGSFCKIEPACAELQALEVGAISCPAMSNNCTFTPPKGDVACLGEIR